MMPNSIINKSLLILIKFKGGHNNLNSHKNSRI